MNQTSSDDEGSQVQQPESVAPPYPGASTAPPYPGPMPRVAPAGPAPEGKAKFFDRPLAKDPIFWIGLAGVLVIGSYTAFRNPSGSPLNPFGLLASSIDALFAAAYAWFLAGFLPALIRRLIRRSKRKSALKNVPAVSEPSWQQDPVNPARYRWWDGSAWSDVVAPPPIRGPNKVAWLLVPAFVVVLLAAWVGGLESSSSSTGAKMIQVADAYGASRDALDEFVRLEVSPDAPLADLPAKESAAQDALQAHREFTLVLSTVTSQEQIGPVPSLTQLRAYDVAADEFLRNQASYFERLNACSPTNRSCFLEADAWYNANKGNAAERLVEAMKAIAEETDNYRSAR